MVAKKRTTITSLRKTLQKAYRSHSKRGGWRAVGDEFGISAAVAYRIANSDYEPKDAHIRHVLGLPAYAEAPVCVKCGKVHVTKRCTERKPPSRWADYSLDELRLALMNRQEL